MKAEYINPLISSFQGVFKSMVNVNFTMGKIFIRNNPQILNKVVIIVGITGELRGQLTITMDIDTAKDLASTMMMGMPVPELDEMAKSAISELGNMIAGNYATGLSEMVLIDITPPTVISGNEMTLSSHKGSQISIPFSSDIGDIIIDISVVDVISK